MTVATAVSIYRYWQGGQKVYRPVMVDGLRLVKLDEEMVLREEVERRIN